MNVQLESSTKIVELMIGGARVPARVWEGVTAGDAAVQAFVTRIAVAQGSGQAEFLRDLQECRQPSPEVRAIPLSLIL